jgi:hypothetical protein
MAVNHCAPQITGQKMNTGGKKCLRRRGIRKKSRPRYRRIMKVSKA